LDRSIFKVTTPIKIDMLEFLTREHPNRPFINYILSGLREGFRYGFTGIRQSIIQRNLASIDMDVQAFEDAIAKEVDLGRYAGPFDLADPPCDTFVVNPCGLVPKKDSYPTQYRVINHQSSPRGKSVNDGIDKAEFATSYENVSHAADWIREFGPGCSLIKMDIKEAYRIIPIHPVDQPLQGVAHEGQLYFDRCLAFGNRASAGIFCRLADIVTWIAVAHGIPAIIHYIDDFLMIVPAGRTEARRVMDLFKGILHAIGLPYKEEKTVGPATCLVYLGISLDSRAMTASITADKKKQITQLLAPWIHRSFIRLKDLQSLIGKLMWVSQVAPQGRVFIQALINRTRGKSKGSALIRLNGACIDDLTWWLGFLPNWDGVSLLEEVQWRDGTIENLFTDASDWGGGATFESYYTWFQWPPDLSLDRYNIQIRELYALLVAVLTFRRFWERRRYIIRTDNLANVMAVRKGGCQNRLVMDLIRSMTRIQIKGSFSLRLVHIPTHLNTNADLLSRGRIKEVELQHPNWVFLQPAFPEDFEHIAISRGSDGSSLQTQRY
jgi:hypothetical protein